MKRVLSFLVLLITAQCIMAEVKVKMERYNGVYRIPCSVNGAKMKFIFDTGASDVCISQTMAEYLLDNGFITSSDIKSTGSSKVADGRVVDHVKINLRDIEIGGTHFRNIDAVVIDGQNAPLLLGQSALKKLGKYSIQGDLLILHSRRGNSNCYTDKEVNEMCNQINVFEANGQYHKAIPIYEELFSKGYLSNDGILCYGRALINSRELQKGIDILENEVNIASLDDISTNRYFTCLSNAYYNIEDLYNYDRTILNAITSLEFSLYKFDFHIKYARRMLMKEYYDCMLEHAWNGMACIAEFLEMDKDQLYSLCYNSTNPNQIIPEFTNDLEEALRYIENAKYFSNRITKETHNNNMRTLARRGFTFAIQYCNKNNIKY